MPKPMPTSAQVETFEMAMRLFRGPEMTLVGKMMPDGKLLISACAEGTWSHTICDDLGRTPSWF